MTRADFGDVLIFRSIEKRLGVRLSGAHFTVGAEVADKSLSRELSYFENGPILAVEMIYNGFSGGIAG